jgi:hypothetical protein
MLPLIGGGVSKETTCEALGRMARPAPFAEVESSRKFASAITTSNLRFQYL